MRAFGRRLKITIYSPDTIETEAVVFESNLMNNLRGLKITGTVTRYLFIQPPEAEVNIYNLSAVDVANILALRFKKDGSSYIERQLRLKIEAGYNNSYFGVIFDGQILKPNMIKPDANNTILKLVCIDGADFIASTDLLSTFNDGVNFYDVAYNVAKGSKIPVNINISEKLKEYKVDGSFVTKSSAYETMQEIASEVGVAFVIKDNTINFLTLDDIFNSQQEAVVLNKNTGLIGIPSLTNDGLTVQSILNPRLDVLKLVQLNNQEISINQPDYLPNRELGAWLSSDGLYRIVQLSHQFDTTTGVFATNCKCLSRNYYDILG